jgi:TonB family protein
MAPRRPLLWSLSRWMMPVLLPLGTFGCSERARAGRQGTSSWFLSAMPDELPQMVNAELPFRYPIPQYLRRVQGNVLLRLYVDIDGHMVPDSTRIMESSGERALDSAALAGAQVPRWPVPRLVPHWIKTGWWCCRGWGPLAMPSKV